MKAHARKCCYCKARVKLLPREVTDFIQSNQLTSPDNAATIEHVYPNGDLRRLLAPNKITLACWRCNNTKGKQDHSRRYDGYRNLEKPNLIYLLLA